MNFSKKELSIFIEIVFTILFAISFLPNFYENRLGTYDLNSSLGKLIEITVFLKMLKIEMIVFLLVKIKIL